MSPCDFENRCCTFIILGSGEGSEKGKRVLCCEKERQEIETGNYPLPSLAFWDTVEEHRRRREMEAGRALYLSWFFLCARLNVLSLASGTVYIHFFSFVIRIFHKNTYR